MDKTIRIKEGQRWKKNNIGRLDHYGEHIIEIVNNNGSNNVSIKEFPSLFIQSRAQSTIQSQYHILKNQCAVSEFSAEVIFDNLEQEIKDKILAEYLKRKANAGNKSDK